MLSWPSWMIQILTSLYSCSEYAVSEYLVLLAAELPPGPVKSFDMNTLQSNNPIEDAHAEAGHQDKNLI